MSLTSVLADFVHRTDAGAIPASALARAREAAVDCLGCMLAGAATETARIVTDVAIAEGGRGKATLIGTTKRASVQGAALVNGVSGHALDYDDINWSMIGHPSVAILPAALAVAEANGRSGRDLVAAFALGVEITAKLGRWANPGLYEHGWHATSAIGTMGAATAAAKLIGLNAGQTAMALGIAASEATGLRRNFGSMTKPFHAGNAARAGVMAAELAQRGFTADPAALEGRFGWFDAFNARAKPTDAELAAQLGQPWDVEEPGIALKLYPACGATHCAIDAMLELKRETRFDAKDVASIQCDSHPLAAKVLLHARPRTGLEGKFSMQFCLAVAAVDGQPGLRHFTERWTADPRVTRLVERVTFEPRANLAQSPSVDAIPSEVTIALNDGRRFNRLVTVSSGDPRKPMSTEARAIKFRDCAAYVMAPKAAAMAWDALEALENAPDTAILTARLKGKPRGTAADFPELAA